MRLRPTAARRRPAPEGAPEALRTPWEGAPEALRPAGPRPPIGRFPVRNRPIACLRPRWYDPGRPAAVDELLPSPGPVTAFELTRTGPYINLSIYIYVYMLVRPSELGDYA